MINMHCVDRSLGQDDRNDFHVKNKAKMNKVIKMMISASSHVFLIGPLPFDHGTDPKDEFVSDIVEDKHFVLSLLGLSFIIGLQFRIVPYSRKSAHCKSSTKSGLILV